MRDLILSRFTLSLITFHDPFHVGSRYHVQTLVDHMPNFDAKTNRQPAPQDGSPPARWLDSSDESLLRACRFDTFRGPGPGGQKRNKTSNSTRLVHLPTRITVIAGESRSQAQNKLRALRRLKLRLAAEIRWPIDPRGFEPPPWFASVVQLGRLAISHRNQHYARTGALVLDLLDSLRGNIGDVARLLGVSSSSIVKFLQAEPELWSAANCIRKAAGHGALEKRR